MHEIKEFQELETESLISLLKEQFKLEDLKTHCNIEPRIEKILQKKTEQLTLFVAKESNIVVGYIVIQWLCELWTDFPEAFISSFYVKQDRRKHGIGTALFEAAIQETKKRKCQRLFLENNRNNPIYQQQYYLKRGSIERKDIAIFEISNFIQGKERF